MRRNLLFILLLFLASSLWADVLPMLTLNDCRSYALQATNSKVGEETKEAARLNREAALAAMFPKVTANAGYSWNSRHASLLPSQMTFTPGTATMLADGSADWQWNDASVMGRLAQQNVTIGSANEQIAALASESGQMVADVYQQLYNALDLDLTHIFVGQVGVTQPIYVGGRLYQLYKIARATEKTVDIEADKKRSDLIVSVDEAYWRVISVEKKQELANQYYDLLVTLENNVQEAVNEGMATQSDLLKVKQKKGEAELKKMQAENGLKLSKMALCQLCGFPLNQDIHLDGSKIDDIALVDTLHNYDAAIEGRQEIQMLDQAAEIAKSNAKLISAGLQPNIVAQANYIYSNPNVENGFKNDWKGHGFFSVGVAVNIPIVHADDILRLKAAQHTAKAVALKREDAKELLNLQITQANQKMMEAQQKVEMTKLGVKNAEEVLRLADEAYKAGMATASDLMMAQTSWMSAASDQIDAEVEAKKCETNYQLYTGTLKY